MDRSKPHRRWNPLTKSWVLVSPQRAARPWRGAVEPVSAQLNMPEFDPTCALCPGVARSSGVVNPKYTTTYVFDNDFPALVPETERAEAEVQANGLVRAEASPGICRVVCFSPRHDLQLPRLDIKTIAALIDLWHSQYSELAELSYIGHIMIFENKGEMMGNSNPHPHGQIWATQEIPVIPAQSAVSQSEYHAQYGRPLLLDYLEWELGQNERIVAQNDEWVALVPYWAVWPYELLVMPRRAAGSIAELDQGQRAAWAALIKETTVRYDNLFKCSFPYSMGVYQRPVDGSEWPGFQLQQLFFPPLLRSANIRKFMVGYELCAEPQRDLTAEAAAARLRECGTRHYLEM